MAGIMKKIAAAATVVVLVSVSLSLWNQERSGPQIAVDDESEAIASSPEVPNVDSMNIEANLPAIELSSQSVADGMDEEALRELQKSGEEWKRSHGYFYSPGNRALDDTYTPLDDDALKTLAETGDMRAAMVLARRLLVKGDVKGYVDNHRLAAILGSTNSMNQIGEQYRRQPPGDEPLTDRERAIESTAWFVISAQMGDIAGHFGYSGSVRRYALGDEESYRAICERATRIRNELAARRPDYGLPDYAYDPLPVLDQVLSESKDVIVKLPTRCSN